MKKALPNPDHVVMHHALEDANVRRLRRDAEPLVAQLRAGTNFVTPQEFLDIVEFFDESIKDPTVAKKNGQVTLFRKIRVVRVHEAYLLTVDEIASRMGVSRSTATRWLIAVNAPHSPRGRIKLYNIQHLVGAMSSLGETPRTGLR